MAEIGWEDGKWIDRKGRKGSFRPAHETVTDTE